MFHPPRSKRFKDESDPAFLPNGQGMGAGEPTEERWSGERRTEQKGACHV